MSIPINVTEGLIDPSTGLPYNEGCMTPGQQQAAINEAAIESMSSPNTAVRFTPNSTQNISTSDPNAPSGTSASALDAAAALKWETEQQIVQQQQLQQQANNQIVDDQTGAKSISSSLRALRNINNIGG